MQKIEAIFLSALSEILHEQKSNKSDAAAEILNSKNPAETISALLYLARQQKIVPLIYDFLCMNDIEIKKDLLPALNQEVASYALTYYQNQYFTELVCGIIEEAGLPYALIKGTLLSELYPKPECRRFGDVDILINEKQAFAKASSLFEEHGFRRRPSNGDHHHEYIIERGNRTYLIELHQNLISSQENPELNDKIGKLYNSLSLDKVLPTTLDALYLILHMLQHFLDAGFGIKLLCDWVLYLEKKKDEIDSDKLKSLLCNLGIFTFAENITIFCIEYLGLRTYPDCFTNKIASDKVKEALEALSEDLFSGGEYGKNDSSRMIIMKGQFHLKDYFLELHRQTKKNYPKLWKTILLLPFLWFFSGIRFLYNNKRVRHTSMRTILETTKKRQRLLEDMEIRL